MTLTERSTDQRPISYPGKPTHMIAEKEHMDPCPPWYHQMDEQGETPLSRAFKSQYPLLVELLLGQEEAQSVTKARSSATSSLQEAAYWGAKERVEQLLGSGADPSAHDARGKTPLMEAACNGHVKTVEMLIEHGADVNTSTPQGLTSLHWVALSGSVDVARILIEQGAEVNPSLATACCPSPAGIALLMGYHELYSLLSTSGGSLRGVPHA